MTEPSTKYITPKKREGKRPAEVSKLTAGCGHIYIAITRVDGSPFEIFALLGKAGGCSACLLEAICRMASLVLRLGADPAQVVKHLSGLRCPNPYMFPEEERTLSCADAIAKALMSHTSPETELSETENEEETAKADIESQQAAYRKLK